MKTWVLNDETKVNSYGFRVKNAGLALDRFMENPVMLAMHRDWDLSAVIGRWKNIRVEGALLLAEAEFDEEDEKAKEIKGKVERGFIKACSLGLMFMRDNMVLNEVDGKFDLNVSEAMEASIVVIGSNAKALVRLYNSDGQLMTEDEVKMSLSAMNTPFVQPIENNEIMEKFNLSTDAAATLVTLGGMTNPQDAANVNAAIEKLSADFKANKTKLEAEVTAHLATKSDLAAVRKMEVKTIIDTAVLQGKLAAGQTEDLATDYAENPEGLKKILSLIPAKKTLSTHIDNPELGGDQPKDLEAFQKLAVEKQLAFKANHPDAYAALFA